MKVVIGISGASGAQYGIRLLEVLKGHETYLIISKTAKQIIEVETGYSAGDVTRLASHVYANDDLAADIASGSCKFDAMVVAPCSMKTLGAIANGISDTLITRVADICLKEGRTLVLVPRETPLSLIHLRNMTGVKEAGAMILPACPGFYPRPKNVSDVIDFIVGRILDVLGIEHELYKRWEGIH